MATKTQLQLNLECGDFIDSIDKSAAKLEDFSDRGSKALKSLNNETNNMSDAQKRVYDVLTRDLKKHQDAVSELAKEYEKLRQKQKSGADLSSEEWKRLKELSKEYKTHTGAIATTSRELETLAKKFNKVKSAETQVRAVTPQLTHSFVNLALSVEGAKLAFDAASSALKEFGLDQDQQIAKMSALKNSTEDAVEVYRLFNDVWRNTNWDFKTVEKMGKAFISAGFSAKEAAGQISLISDAVAGLGLDEGIANDLVKDLLTLKTAGKLEEDTIKKFSRWGIDLGKLFAENFNTTAENALKGIKEGKISGSDAYKIIVEHVGNQYSGSMAASKDNVKDIVGDITGNLTTAAGEIGAALINASGIKSAGLDLVDATQSFLNVIRDYNKAGNMFEAMTREYGESTATKLETARDVLLSIAGLVTTLNGVGKLKEIAEPIVGAQKAITFVPAIQQAQELRNQIEALKETGLNLAIGSLFEIGNDKTDTKKLDEINKKLAETRAKYEETASSIWKLGKISGDAFGEEGKKLSSLSEQLKYYYNQVNKYTVHQNIQSKLLSAAKATGNASEIIRLEKEIEATSRKLATAQDNLNKAMSSFEGIVGDVDVNVKSLVASNKLWHAATVSSWSSIGNLAKANLAASLSFTSLKASAVGALASIKAVVVNSLKTIALAFTKFLITPAGLAVAALAMVGTAGYFLWKNYKENTSKLASDVAKNLKSITEIDLTITTPEVNTANFEKFAIASRAVADESSELGQKIKEVADKAKDYEVKLRSGAITQDEYNAKMQDLAKSANKLKGELAALSSKTLSNKDVQNATAELEKQNIAFSDLSDSIDKMLRLDKALDFSGIYENKLNDLQTSYEALYIEIERTKDAMTLTDDTAELSKLQNKLDELTKSYQDLGEQIEEMRDLSSSYKDLLIALKGEQNSYNVLLANGEISTDAYNKSMGELYTIAKEVRANMLTVSTAVNAASQAMQDGIIDAEEYASAIAAIAMASAKLSAGQKGLTEAMQSGNEKDQTYWQSYIASAAAEISYEKDLLNKKREGYKLYGADGRGTKEAPRDNVNLTDKKGADKARSEALKKLKEEESYQLELLKMKQEQATHELDLDSKTNEAKKANEVELLRNMQQNYEAFGAKESAFNQKRIADREQANLEILKSDNNYAKQKLAVEQQAETLRTQLAFMAKQEELGLVEEAEKKAHEHRKDLLNKQLAETDRSIKELIASHNQDVITIKVKAAINEFNADVANKVNELRDGRTAEDQGTVGIIRQKAQDEYNAAQSETTAKYTNYSEQLSTANANGDVAQMVSIGQLLGMSEEELNAKSATISSLYDTINGVMANSAAQEIASNESALESAQKHADTIKNVQDAAKQYCVTIGKNFGSAIASWINGTKTLSDAMKDFAKELITNAIEIMTQWAAVFALVCAFEGPRAASKAANKAVLNIDTFANGGYVLGPGTSRSDSIPAMLSNGEYVLNANAVKAVGVGRLNAINQGNYHAYANGGFVGDSTSPVERSNYEGEGNHITLNISALDAASFENWLSIGNGLKAIKQATKNNARNFETAYGTF